MKKIYLILLLAISLTNCKAQQKNSKIMIPKIDKEFEKFDIKTFIAEVNKISGKRIISTEESYIEEDYQDPGYSRVTYNNSYSFYILELFFENGNIQKKGILFNNGSQYGIWYNFDEKGNLTEEINTEEGYDFGWKQVIKYCEKNKIELTKGYKRGGYQTSIYKEKDKEGNKVWHIDYLAVINDTGIMTQIFLDGRTGELLEKREAEFEGN